MDELKDTLSDWTAINTAKRLRGALLHCARVYRRHGDKMKSASIIDRVRKMPRRMGKEAINTVLMSACIEFGIM